MALLSRKDAPLRVDIPNAKQDRALTSKVGLVAVVGFGLGILWPRLVGYNVGPDLPGGGSGGVTTASGASASASAKPAAARPSGEAMASPSGSPSEAATEEPSADAGPSNRETVVVGDGKVESCKGKKGDKTEDCGKLSFDKIAKTRLAELARCPAAIGLEGKMTLAITVNFERNDITVDNERKKSGLPSDTVRGVLVCAGKELKGVELEKIPHTHQRYSLSYEVSFYPPGKAPNGDEPAKGDDAQEEKSLGRATVTQDRALVREAPKTGKVVVRLVQGTRVKLVEQQGDWYKIESSKGKGWVYRQAIGK